MKGCHCRGLMGLPLVAAPNADFQVILRRKSHVAHLLSISENPFNASRWYLRMHEPAFVVGFFDMWFKPTSTLQIYREIATVREAKRSNLYMTVIEYHRKYFHHIINVTLIEKKALLYCVVTQRAINTTLVGSYKAIKRIIIKGSLITLHTSSWCGQAAVEDREGPKKKKKRLCKCDFTSE